MSDIPPQLLVQRETSILALPRRLLRPYGCHIPLADGDVAGVDILERESNARTISGRRMPQLSDKTPEHFEAKRLQRLEAGITKMHWGASGSAAAEPEFQAGE
jgi:hypothetical protein